MTQSKAKDLKLQMCNEFNQIFLLCQSVLQTANEQQLSLVLGTLETLLKFLNWIPLGYIFESDIVSLIATKV